MAGIPQIRVAFRLGIDDSLPTVEDPVLSDSDSGLKRGNVYLPSIADSLRLLMKNLI